MLKPNEEAQSIKRVETINLKDIKEIKTCDDLIEICLEIIEKININISDFIMENKIFGYSHRFEIHSSLNETGYFKEKLLQKRKVTNDLSCLIEYIVKYNRNGVLSDIIELTGVYYMYQGNFSKGIGLINFSRSIGGSDHNIVTDVEVLNEFIFKYNLSVDITKLDNYKEAVQTLQLYYDKNFRLDRGDQLLIVIYESLNQVKKSRKILESIYNVSNNALFHYEIGKGSKRNKNKGNIVFGIILLICISGGFIYTKFSGEKSAKVDKQEPNKGVVVNSKNTTEKTQVETPKVEKKAEKKEEQKPKPVEKPLDIVTLKSMIEGNINKGSIDNIEKQLALLEGNGNIKNSNDFKKLKDEFITKKQTVYYNLGRESFKSGKFDNAINELTAAYNIRKGDYLDPHITYYLASAVNKVNNKDSLKYYKEYINKYDKLDNSYTEEAMYNIAIINWSNKNTSEAKKYAKRLVEKYPNSMYNNEKIKAILA